MMAACRGRLTAHTSVDAFISTGSIVEKKLICVVVASAAAEADGRHAQIRNTHHRAACAQRDDHPSGPVVAAANDKKK